jgi:hypothetical protein
VGDGFASCTGKATPHPARENDAVSVYWYSMGRQAGRRAMPGRRMRRVYNGAYDTEGTELQKEICQCSTDRQTVRSQDAAPGPASSAPFACASLCALLRMVILFSSFARQKGPAHNDSDTPTER